MPDSPITPQAIAATEFGLQQAPIRTERLSDSSRMNLERVLRDNGTWPYAVHQLVFGDEFARRQDQDFEHLEGTSANRYGRAENPKLAADEINLAVAGCVDRFGMTQGDHPLQNLPKDRA